MGNAGKRYSKLSGKTVTKIRKMYNSGKYTQKELAARFGISRASICYIVNNKTHIPGNQYQVRRAGMTDKEILAWLLSKATESESPPYVRKVYGPCMLSHLVASKGSGYCMLTIGKKIVSAHRFVRKVVYGPIPDGFVVRHRCDVRICINPKHLLIGTVKDNIRDMVVRKRHPHGETIGTSKLTSKEVIVFYLDDGAIMQSKRVPTRSFGFELGLTLLSSEVLSPRIGLILEAVLNWIRWKTQ